MRPRTAVAFVAVVAILGGTAMYATFGVDPISTAAPADSINSSNSTGLTNPTAPIRHALSEQWVSIPPEQGLESNHHMPDAVYVDGEAYVAVPLNSRQGTVCELQMLDGAGHERWHDTIPEGACTVHSLSDPTIADFDNDGHLNVMAATSGKQFVVWNLTTGAVEYRYNLNSYGYSRPIFANFTAASGNETTVIDLSGGLVVFRSNRTVAWKRQFGDARTREPTITDFDADGTQELLIGQLIGRAILLRPDGHTEWNRTFPNTTATKWMATGQADDDPVVEAAFATFKGHIVLLDGKNGTVQWDHDLNARGASVNAIGDGDSDGQPEIYAAARDGKIRALNATDGSIEWTTTLTTGNVLVMPPPVLGDVNGDGTPELVAVTGDGIVRVVDPRMGEITATYRRKVPINTFPRLADIDGDDVSEILVIYGDGRVVALSYR